MELKSSIPTEHFVALVCENRYLKIRVDDLSNQLKRSQKQFKNLWKAFRVLKSGLYNDGEISGRREVISDLLESLDSSRVMEKELENLFRKNEQRDRDLQRLHVIEAQKGTLESELRILRAETEKLEDINEELKNKLEQSISQAHLSSDERLHSLEIELEKSQKRNLSKDEECTILLNQNMQLSELVSKLESNRKALLMDKERHEQEKIDSNDLLDDAKMVMNRLQDLSRAKESEYNTLINELEEKLRSSEEKVERLKRSSGKKISSSSSKKVIYLPTTSPRNGSRLQQTISSSRKSLNGITGLPMPTLYQKALIKKR